MPNSLAACLALSRSLEAIAVTSDHSPRCIAGMTFFTAMLATPKTPHSTFFFISFLLVVLSAGSDHKFVWMIVNDIRIRPNYGRTNVRCHIPGLLLRKQTESNL